MQSVPRLRSDDAVRFNAAFLLESGHSDLRFLSEVPIHRQTISGAAQGALKEDDILSIPGWVLQPELPGESGHRFLSPKQPISRGADDPIRRQSMGSLKAPDRGCGCGAIQTIDANRDAMLAQESLKLDHTWSPCQRMS
jgi:hypothetical protein